MRGEEYSFHFLNLCRAADGNNGLGSRTTCELAPDFCWKKNDTRSEMAKTLQG